VTAPLPVSAEASEPRVTRLSTANPSPHRSTKDAPPDRTRITARRPLPSSCARAKSLPSSLDKAPGRDYCALQQLLHCNNRRSTTNWSNLMTGKNNLNVFNDLTNTSVERITALGELNLKVVEKIAARQMEVMNQFVEQGARLMTMAADAKGYSDYYKGQVDLAKEITDRLMSESKANLQVAAEARDDYRSWFDAMIADVRNSKDVVRNAVTA